MSKIKDLFAEEENIDDLKVPVRYGKDFYDSVQASDLERFYNAVLKRLKESWVEDELRNLLVVGEGGTDEGYSEPYFDNYTYIIKAAVDEAIDELIENEHYDLSDSDYKKIYPKLVEETADYWYAFSTEHCKNLLNDDKFKLTELKERNGEC